MVVAPTRYRLLDPTVKAIIESASMAQRPGDLEGKVVGLLANGKRNSDRLLDALYSLLQDTYHFGGVVRLNKRDVSRPARKEIIDELVKKCDVVITATGD